MMTDQFECAFVTGFRDKPGEFVIFMLSIIIEKEDFEVNCIYKTRSWQMGFISRHR
jgi:hypothetical protein